MLLIRPSPKIAEHLPNYLLRLSAANGYKNPTVLLRTWGQQLANNRLPGKKIFLGQFDLEGIARVTNISPNELLQHKVHLSSANRCSFQGRSYRLKFLRFNHVRLCPECYQENGIINFVNTLIPKTYCVKHERPLIWQHPGTTKALTWGTHYLWRDIPNWLKLGNTNSICESEVLLNKNIELLAENAPLDLSTPFEGINLEEYIDLISFLAHFHHRAFGSDKNSKSKLSCNYTNTLYAPAFWYLRDWPQKYFELLEHFEYNPMSNSRKSGIRRCFRDLYDELYDAENANLPAYKLLRKYFELYLSDHFSAGALIDSISLINNNTVQSANLLNEKQSCKLLNCPPSRLKVYARECLIPVTKELETGVKLFTRADILNLKIRITNCLSLAGCAQRLHISHYQMRKLLSSDIIPSLLSPSESNRDWLIEKRDIERLITKLKSLSKNTISGKNTSIKRLAFTGLDIVQLLTKMLNNNIHFSYQGNTSDPLSLSQFTPEYSVHDLPNSNYLTPLQASEELGVNINAIYHFMKCELLQSTKIKVKRTPRPVKVIPVKSIKYFKSHYLFKSQTRCIPSDALKAISGPSIDGGVVNLYIVKSKHTDIK